MRRVGRTVRRPLAAWSPAVHDLLRYLDSAGFPAPAVVGTDGEEEILTWIDDESGADGWARIVSETGLRRWARFLRHYHDVVAGYRPAQASQWASGTGTAATCKALGRRGVEPQATWVREGYLDELDARIRWTESIRI